MMGNTRVWKGVGGAKFENRDVIFARITPCLEHGKMAKVSDLTSARGFGSTWFVHLRFPGHEHTTITNGVPVGWEKKNIGDVSPFKYGKSLKKEDRLPGPYPVYGSSGVVGRHVKALVTGPAIIVGRKGNVGSVYWSKNDCHPIDTVYYIEADHCTTHLYYALLHTQFINTDVAVPGLNRDFAHSRKLIIPEPNVLGLFEERVVVIHEEIDQLAKYNGVVAKARDLLLPRLMNGKVKIQNKHVTVMSCQTPTP